MSFEINLFYTFPIEFTSIYTKRLSIKKSQASILMFACDPHKIYLDKVKTK